MTGAGQAERKAKEEVPRVGENQAWEITEGEQAAELGGVIQ